jgi:hypothetical protein
VARLWRGKTVGAADAETRWYGTRREARAAAKRIFRRTWDKDGKVNKEA